MPFVKRTRQFRDPFQKNPPFLSVKSCGLEEILPAGNRLRKPLGDTESAAVFQSRPCKIVDDRHGCFLKRLCNPVFFGGLETDDVERKFLLSEKFQVKHSAVFIRHAEDGAFGILLDFFQPDIRLNEFHQPCGVFSVYRRKRNQRPDIIQTIDLVHFLFSAPLKLTA